MNKYFFLVSTAVVALFLFGTANAKVLGLKQRMAIIKALKIKGIVGENNKGFLEFRGKKRAAKVVAQENADRRKTYEDIAKKQGVSVEEVGRQRAIQIAAQAVAGVWLQNLDGTWYKKK